MNNLLRRLDALITSPGAQHIAAGWRGMANLLLPNPCVLCVWNDAEHQQLCKPCANLLKSQTKQIIQAQDFADALPLDLVTGQPLPVFSASYYTPEIAKVLLRFKDHQRIHVAKFFRPIMYRTLVHVAQHFQAPNYRLVPIPASGASMRRRGYNPVEELLPKTLPNRYQIDTRVLTTRWQLFRKMAHHGTGIQTRREESRKKFRLTHRYRPPAEPVVLVDDVLTTGATLGAATRTLQISGFDVVAAIVMSAVTPRS